VPLGTRIVAIIAANPVRSWSTVCEPAGRGDAASRPNIRAISGSSGSFDPELFSNLNESIAELYLAAPDTRGGAAELWCHEWANASQ
jgi:hypothetical protein